MRAFKVIAVVLMLTVSGVVNITAETQNIELQQNLDDEYNEYWRKHSIAEYKMNWGRNWFLTEEIPDMEIEWELTQEQFLDSYVYLQFGEPKIDSNKIYYFVKGYRAVKIGE